MNQKPRLRQPQTLNINPRHVGINGLVKMGMVLVFNPDNLRSAMRKAHRYTPDLNPAYNKWRAIIKPPLCPPGLTNPKIKPKQSKRSFSDVIDPDYPHLIEKNDCRISPSINAG